MTAETDLAIGTKLPIIFSYRDALFGNNFVVEVHARNGRALCAREEDGFWMYGVNPGGMSARGEKKPELPCCSSRPIRAPISLSTPLGLA